MRFEKVRDWIKGNVTSPVRPRAVQIANALEGLRTTSREMVKRAQKENRTREQPIEWRPDTRNVYVNDPFLKLYIKWGDWPDEYVRQIDRDTIFDHHESL